MPKPLPRISGGGGKETMRALGVVVVMSLFFLGFAQVLIQDRDPDSPRIIAELAPTMDVYVDVNTFQLPMERPVTLNQREHMISDLEQFLSRHIKPEAAAKSNERPGEVSLGEVSSVYWPRAVRAEVRSC